MSVLSSAAPRRRRRQSRLVEANRTRNHGLRDGDIYQIIGYDIHCRGQQQQQQQIV